MTHDLWRLSGPALFLERLLDQVREGKSVVIDSRSDAPADIQERILREVRNAGISAFSVAGAGEPLALLSAALLGADSHPSLDALCDGCHGLQCFVVDLTASDSCAQWTGFLGRLQHRARQNSTSQRPVLVLLRRGAWHGPIPKADVAVSLHSWTGVVTEADFLSYAYSLISPRSQPGLERRALAHVLAGVALWDVELMTRLATASKREMMEPGPKLIAYARERQWSSGACGDTDHGAEIEGRYIEHSAFLALSGRHTELSRRIWAAQSLVLLPWVEETRLKLLDDIAPWLQGSLHPQDLQEMEIGDIWFRLDRSLSSHELKKSVRILRDVRNYMAHRTCIPYDYVWHLATSFGA